MANSGATAGMLGNNQGRNKTHGSHAYIALNGSSEDSVES